MGELTIYELSSHGRTGVTFPEADVPKTELPMKMTRNNLPLPELSEADVVRHFTHLSKLNYSVDGGFYPLGSCTMKYNPKINEASARLPGFVQTHPLQPEETVQGNLALMFHLQEWLKEISGFSSICLEPSAGAQGEMVGVAMIRAYHKERKNYNRRKMLIPDSAHGTNPASSAMEGFEIVNVPTDSLGNVDLKILRSVCDENTAGIMLTNPNTLGLFDQNVTEVIDIVHKAGGLVYGDGANLNALLGILKPCNIGIDVMHFNLHKTFSTPHGGGGPGSGPVGANVILQDFLPEPIVGIIEPATEELPALYGFQKPMKTIGRVKSFHGQFGILIRAFIYIMMNGSNGMREVAKHSVLNANYIMAKIKKTYRVPYDRFCMHEFVMEGKLSEAPQVIALDISKRLMDYDFHPPTNYFPLIVQEALMIEPTETENKQTCDQFINALLNIADEIKTKPSLLKEAPHHTPVGRLDEVKAARDLVLCCWLPD
jgi:glycine dehydrogenase subunit 2